MNTTRTIAGGLGLALLTLLVSACGSQPTRTEQGFGDSVRQMIRAQTDDPNTLSTPAPDRVDGTDGQVLGGALEAYRGDVADRGAVRGPVAVGVGAEQP